jgi:ABC-type multidrug transport system fused ATPase/permease subunit
MSAFVTPLPLRPTSPTLQSEGAGSVATSNEHLEDYYMDLFLPQRTGRRSAWAANQIVLLLLTIAIAMVSLMLSVLGGVCFAAGTYMSPPCYWYLEPLRDSFMSLSTHHWGRLMSCVVWVVSIVVALRAVSSLWERVLRWRRNKRLRRRVVSAMAGSSSRHDVTRKLMRGLRSVVELVHDSSLKVDLSFEGLSYRLRDGTYVLTDASGAIAATGVTVVMGPSGCGKSTLLNLLSGKLQPERGSVCLNGKPGSVRELHKLIGFVPQDDVMLTELTVMELLRFSASIRLPANLPKRQLVSAPHPPRTNACPMA